MNPILTFGNGGSSQGKILTSLLTHFLSINRAKKLTTRLAAKINPCGKANGEVKSLRRRQRLVERSCGEDKKLVARLVAKAKGKRVVVRSSREGKKLVAKPCSKRASGEALWRKGLW